jgi:hypothetical protein
MALELSSSSITQATSMPPSTLDALNDHDSICERCSTNPSAGVRLPAAFDLALTRSMPDALLRALQSCAACLAHDARTIDRAHVEAVHALFGPMAVPLEPWLAARAVVARPELGGAPQLVVDDEAALVSPAESWERRLEALVRANAPEVVIEGARTSLARARARDVRLEWERVRAWPAEEVFLGTVAFGEIARVLAAHALPSLLGGPAVTPVLAAIDRAAAMLVLGDEALAYRHELHADSQRTTDMRRARGLELAVRFLDELGHTDLRTNQDTLVDDCYFALARFGEADEAAAMYRCWLERAVPRAWRRVVR